MLTEKLSTGANGQREDAASFFCPRRFDRCLFLSVRSQSARSGSTKSKELHCLFGESDLAGKARSHGVRGGLQVTGKVEVRLSTRQLSELPVRLHYITDKPDI